MFFNSLTSQFILHIIAYLIYAQYRAYNSYIYKFYRFSICFPPFSKCMLDLLLYFSTFTSQAQIQPYR